MTADPSPGARHPDGIREEDAYGRDAAAGATVGAWLRAARESAGLTQDGVAQQLKLHPRQVRALEEDDFGLLPGRTFVRGFVRNYARLVHLDAEALVAALPVGEPTSPLERLTYSPSSRPMGEIPIESPRRGGGVARWLIPLLLLAIVGVAGYYEFTRARLSRPAVSDGVMPPPPPMPAAPAAGPAVTTLPNPLDAAKGEAAAPGVAGNAAAGAAPPPASPAATEPAAPVASAAAPPGNDSTVAPAGATTAAAEPALVLSFTGASWVQVKDATGTVVASQTATPGVKLPVAGRPPFDLVIGNADHVRAEFRGKPVDLAPYTRSNVARLTLK